MIATKLIRRAERSGETAFDTITLSRDDRYKRRFRAKTDGGRDLVVTLVDATVFGDGDLFFTEEGLIEVRAAAEPLLEITAADALSLAKVAWHLGNRHTAAEIAAGAIYIQPDHVLEHMIEGLGAKVKHVSRPFEPERGAYAGGHSHGGGHQGHHHHHHHEHDH